MRWLVDKASHIWPRRDVLVLEERPGGPFDHSNTAFMRSQLAYRSDLADFMSTPSGRLMFQIIGAMAEFERSLIQERVRAGLRNAKLKGKTLGRPRRIVNGGKMIRLCEQGASFREIAKAVGTSPWYGSHASLVRMIFAASLRSGLSRLARHAYREVK